LNGPPKNKKNTPETRLAADNEAAEEISFGRFSMNGSKSASYMTSGSELLVSFVVNSGCSDHMVPEEQWVSNLRELIRKIQIANGAFIQSGKMGNMKCRQKSGFPILKLVGVLVVPSLDVPLLSISSLRRSCIDTILRGNEVEFKLGNQVCVKGVLRDKLYYLDLMIDRNFICARLTHQIFHNRLGHLSDRKLKQYLALNPHVVVDAPKENFFCEPCMVGKFRKCHLMTVNKRMSC
jgi:hypothetical protein